MSVLPDMKRFRGHLSTSNPSDPLTNNVSGVAEKKSGFNIMKLVVIVLACSMILLVLLTFSFIKREPFPGEHSRFAEARSFQMKDEEVQNPLLHEARESAEARGFKTEAGKGGLKGFAEARSFQMNDGEVRYPPLDGAWESLEQGLSKRRLKNILNFGFLEN